MFLLKKNNFLKEFRLELKKNGLELKKWAGIKYFGLELNFFNRKSVFFSLFFLLKKKLFLKLFRLELKKKSAGIKYFWLELKKSGLELKKMGWN